MDQDLPNSETFSNSYRMLTSSTSKSSQAMLRSVMALCFSQGTDWPSHRFVRNLDEAVRNLIWCHLAKLIRRDLLIDPLREFLEKLLARFLVQALVLILAEDFGEEFWKKPTKE